MQSKTLAKKPFLLILYGYPGSGKSTFARQFAGEVQNTIHINTDKVHKELGRELKRKGVDNLDIYDPLVEYMTREYVKSGFNVILDMPMSKKSERRRIQNLSKDLNVKIVMAWLQIDADSAFDRLKKRDKRKINDKYARNYTRSEFESAVNSSQNPNGEDYVVISGKHAFNTQKLAVTKRLREMGIVGSEFAINRSIKPELVNLIPQTLRGRGDIKRRDISIR